MELEGLQGLEQVSAQLSHSFELALLPDVIVTRVVAIIRVLNSLARSLLSEIELFEGQADLHGAFALLHQQGRLS